MLKGLFSIYMIILGITIGIEFAAGALVAPIIFNPAPIFGDGVLSHFQSGQLMTQIFLRFNLVLVFSTSILFFVEILSFWTGQKDSISSILVLICVVGVGMFVFYYTPYIVEAQRTGIEATRTLEFNTIHKGSEIIMKGLMIVQTALFFRRFYLAIDNKI